MRTGPQQNFGLPSDGTGPCLRALLVAAVCLTVGCSTSEHAETPQDELVGEPARPTPGPTEDSKTERETREGALWYRIAADGPVLDITLRLLAPPSNPSMFLPASNRRAASRRALTLAGVRGPEGALPYDQLPKSGRVDIQAPDARWVEVSYRVDLEAFPDRGGRPRPDVGADGTVLGYLPDLLVVPSKQIADRLRAIPVEIHAPAAWTVRATWSNSQRGRSKQMEGRRVHGYVARDVRTLRDAFFVAGPDLKMERVPGEKIAIAFQPDLAVPHDQFASLVARVTGAYRSEYGTVGPVLVYARRARSGSDSGVRGTAKRNGFVVHLPQRQRLRDDVRVLVAHEAFHLWNGHHAIPSPASEEGLRWFEEGVTHYVGVKTLHEIGLLGLDDVRGQLAKSAFFYRRNPAAGNGRASRLDLDRLPYDRGVLLALALDGALHRCSSNRVSIREWLRRLFGDESSYYDVESLKHAYFSTRAGECGAGRRIWTRHVEREEPLKPSRLFADVGLHYLEAATVEESKVLPLEGHRPVYESIFEEKSRPENSDAAQTRHLPEWSTRP